ncbi:DUF799 domain-containing protein [Neisseria cinerea]|nr:DUF799 domain-containing protein [Neisseria cinerea]MCD2070595.1 DUF799 domain-containing protein [Neisseria cinerea]
MKQWILGLTAVLTLSACQVQKVPDFDYSAFKESKPASILVVPPLNESPDVNATWGMLTSTALPLSEAGYYVFPVAVAEQTFKQNGLTNAADIHAVRPEKLHEIFGNDAVLYITVTEYGTSYQILDSVTSVSAKARLVDSRNGKELWSGTANIREGSNNGNSGLLGALVGAIVNQIANSLTDRGYKVSKTAAYSLLSPYTHNGILKGPRFVETQSK